jgi:hypothetical protein
MNLKKCKLLRRKAEEQTVDYPNRDLRKHKSRPYTVNNELTTRGFYRKLKKMVRRKEITSDGYQRTH